MDFLNLFLFRGEVQESALAPRNDTVVQSSPYSSVQWRLELKKLLLLCGGESASPQVLFIPPALSVEPMVLEDISYLLRDYDIPTLFTSQDWKSIFVSLETLYYDETRIRHPRFATSFFVFIFVLFFVYPYLIVSIHYISST
jgi:hypothetical protein